MDAKAAESLLAFAGQTIPGLRGLDVEATSAEIEQRYGDLKRVRAGREMTARAAVDFALGSGSASARQ